MASTSLASLVNRVGRGRVWEQLRQRRERFSNLTGRKSFGSIIVSSNCLGELFRNDYASLVYGSKVYFDAKRLSSSRRTVVTCGNCNHSGDRDASKFVELVSCPKCGALQKIGEVKLPNFFQILGHDKSYRVNLNEIANKTKQLQKRFHPDLHGGKGEEQQHLSQEYSSLVNKALSTLTDPIARGKYMLSLEGISVEDAGENNIEATMTNDPEFLEEIMELNEKLVEISSESEWKEFRQSNSEMILKFHRDLEKSFDDAKLKEAQLLLGRMQYYATIQAKLKERQSKIGIVE